MKTSSLKDTICAISTPVGEAGIGIVRLSGKKALRIADEIFMSKNGKRPSQLPGYTVHYGHIIKKSKTKNQKSKTKTMNYPLAFARDPSARGPEYAEGELRTN